MARPADVETLGREILRQLTETTGPCVSMFLPTHRGGTQTNQGPIRLKNLLKRAEEQLEQQGMRAVEARERLAAGADLVDDYEFWQYQGDGLAVYLAPRHFSTWKLPGAVEERVSVGDRFRLIPLFAVRPDDGVFHVLALSQNRVRLVRCTRQRAEETDLGGAPASLREALAEANIQEDDSFQVRVSAASPAPAPGAPSSIFYGRGRVEVDPAERVQEFLRQVDAGVCRTLQGERSPVILAGVETLLSLYRQVSRCPVLAEEGVAGNPDLLTPDQLRDQALGVAGAVLRRVYERDRERFVEGQGTHRSSNEWADVVRGAVSGRVEALFAAEVEHWGRMDARSWEVSLHAEREAGDTDLNEYAAVEAWLNGARVHIVGPAEVPGSGEIAALFRYAVRAA